MSALITAVAALALVGLITEGAPTHSLADDAPVAADHPLVGSWSGAGFLFTFSADGTATGTDTVGLTYHGAWQSAGAGTGTFILHALLPKGGGQGMMGPIMVSGDGNELITAGGRYERMIPPDAADYDFSAPAP